MRLPLGASALAFLAVVLLSRLPQAGWGLAILASVLAVTAAGTILEMVARRTWQRRLATLGILVSLAWARPESAVAEVPPAVVALIGLVFLHFLYVQQTPPTLGVLSAQVGQAILACFAATLVLAPIAASSLPWVWGAFGWEDLRELHLGGFSLYLGTLLFVVLAAAGAVASLRSSEVEQVRPA